MNRRLGNRSLVAVLGITLAAGPLFPGTACAEEREGERSPVTDVVYKGLMGKALDAVPMDPEHRAALQRANAVVSGTMTGRSLSVWAGLTNPLLLIGGLVWGLFSASNIKPEPAREADGAKRLAPTPGESRTETAGAAGDPLEPETPSTEAVAALAGDGLQGAAAVDLAPALSISFDIAAPDGRPFAETPERERGPDLAANL